MLEDVKIARPCGADWDKMTGDDRVRFCQLCQLNVYNLSGMKREDAETLLASREGKVCVRLYKRDDGTVLTQDCPVGLAAVRRRIGSLAASAAALVTVFWAGLGRAAEPADGPVVESKSIATSPFTTTPTATTPTATTPTATPPVTPPRVLMGRPAMKDPGEKQPQSVPPKPANGRILMGEAEAPR
ncbi:MAG: hypothetical protein ACAI25_11625 [Planctomycetota bacterium]